MDEMKFQSIADLPALEALGDGDYLVTVSGGKGRLLPAGNFSGGGGGSFARVKLKDAQSASDSQILVTLYNEDGTQITDAEAFASQIQSGYIQYEVDLDDLAGMGLDMGLSGGISISTPELVIAGRDSTTGEMMVALIWYLILFEAQVISFVGNLEDTAAAAISLDEETQPSLRDRILSLLRKGGDA